MTERSAVASGLGRAIILAAFLAGGSPLTRSLANPLPESRLVAQAIQAQAFPPSFMPSPLSSPERGLDSEERDALQKLYDSNNIQARVTDSDIVPFCKATRGLIRGPAIKPLRFPNDAEERALIDITSQFIGRSGLTAYSFIAIDETDFGGKIVVVPITAYDCG